MTPEVELIEAYNTWLNSFLASGAVVDPVKLEAELEPYITAETVLKEPSDVPWGGTMIGYEGWAHFFRESAPTFRHFAGRYDVTEPAYYQRGNVVFREMSSIIKGATADAPTALVITLVEKYIIADGRIVQMIEFWDDPALFRALLETEGVNSQ